MENLFLCVSIICLIAVVTGLLVVIIPKSETKKNIGFLISVMAQFVSMLNLLAMYLLKA